MAIYISGVKGLPEQVQENKEKIANIEEEIEGIDFDEIRELEDQVNENTNDINNIEGTIGTQNIAINNLDGRINTLEQKTTAISYDGGTFTTAVEDTLKADTIEVEHNFYSGAMIGNNDYGRVILPQTTTGVGSDLILQNKANGTTHELTLANDGTLTLDGNPVGGGAYQHNITFNNSFSNISYTLSFLSDIDTSFTNNQQVAFTTALRDAICNAVLSKNPIPTGYTGVNKVVAGGIYQSGANFYVPFSCLVQANNIICNYYKYSSGTLSVATETLSASYTINDQCVAL